MPNFLQVTISSPSRKEADFFSDELVKQKLVAGCLVIEGMSRYWWNGEIAEKTYWNVQAFTIESNKSGIIDLIESIASDDCPIISFVQIDGNSKFLTWIETSMAK